MTQFHPRKENRRIEDSRVSNWDFSSQGKFDLLHLKLDFVVVKKVVIDIEMKSLIYAMHQYIYKKKIGGPVPPHRPHLPKAGTDDDYPFITWIDQVV